MGYRVVVVGASRGGLSAAKELVAGLRHRETLPVVLVQHRDPRGDDLFVSLLQDQTPLEVCEAEDKMSIERGTVYVAQADYHLLIVPDHFELSTDAPVRHSRPSIDVTFASAADAYGAEVVGIMLTGTSSDGALGLRRIAARGGRAIVQDPATAEQPAMPTAALRSVPEARVVRLAEISHLITDLSAIDATLDQRTRPRAIRPEEIA